MRSTIRNPESGIRNPVHWAALLGGTLQMQLTPLLSSLIPEVEITTHRSSSATKLDWAWQPSDLVNPVPLNFGSRSGTRLKQA